MMVEIPTQNIQIDVEGISIDIRREDLIHPFVSGNKFRKLRYNFLRAKAEKQTTLLTFGGAFSNHIAAVAFAGKENNFKTIGIIRGEELIEKVQENPTLTFAQENGMQLEFVSRSAYSEKESRDFLQQLQEKFGQFYLIPEGGTNELAVKGCQEILTEADVKYNYICCAVGTGGTISGIINSASSHQKVLGFPALKGAFLQKEITKFVDSSNWELIEDYHFGGYAKVNAELISFINQFSKNNKVPLDPVYTGKMAFGVFDLAKKGYFAEGSKILLIHTGGLQGIAGMNQLLQKKNLPKIENHV